MQATHRKIREVINYFLQDKDYETGKLKVRCIAVDKWNKIFGTNYIREDVNSYDRKYVEHCKYIITMDVRVDEEYLALGEDDRLCWAGLGELISFSAGEIVVNENGTIVLVEQAGRGCYGRILKCETLLEPTLLEFLEQLEDLLESV